MKLSALCKLLESVSLALDLYGRVPDLTVCDAIATGWIDWLIFLFLSILLLSLSPF